MYFLSGVGSPEDNPEDKGVNKRTWDTCGSSAGSRLFSIPTSR